MSSPSFIFSIIESGCRIRTCRLYCSIEATSCRTLWRVIRMKVHQGTKRAYTDTGLIYKPGKPIHIMTGLGQNHWTGHVGIIPVASDKAMCHMPIAHIFIQLNRQSQVLFQWQKKHSCFWHMYSAHRKLNA